MLCEAVLPLNRVRGEITEGYYYKLCLYMFPKTVLTKEIKEARKDWSDKKWKVYLIHFISPLSKWKCICCWIGVCCVFWPGFGFCAHPKAGWNTVFQPFSTFFLRFKPFSMNFCLKSRKKHLKKRLKKLCFKLLIKAGRHANA